MRLMALLFDPLRRAPHHARAVDSTILLALSAIATKQANPTEKTRALNKITVRLLYNAE